MRGITNDLRHVVELTEIKHVEKEDKIISEGTEEGALGYLLSTNKLADIFPALKLDTLLKLSGSTSHDLRSAYDPR